MSKARKLADLLDSAGDVAGGRIMAYKNSCNIFSMGVK